MVTRDTVFDEEKTWEWIKKSVLETRLDGHMFIVHYIPFPVASEMEKSGDQIVEGDSHIDPFLFKLTPHSRCDF